MEKSTDQEWLSLKDMERMLGIGSTKAYELVTSGEVPAVRIGRSIRISKTELEAWLERQPYIPAQPQTYSHTPASLRGVGDD